ncbi:MAG: ABC transporter permease [Saprospiraceae bacterium]
MIKHYLKTAFRNLFKHKLFSFVNILGLGLGMACCFLILIFVRHEFSFDNFQKNVDRIGRVNYTASFGNSATVLARIPPPIAPLMPDFFPEVKYAARMFPRSVSVEVREGAAGNGVARFEVPEVAFVDSNLLDILTFDFIEGDPLLALKQPFSVILTEEMARQFFGSTEVLGKTIHFLSTYPFRVTGVIKDHPDNSSLRFNLLVPYENMYDIEGETFGPSLRNNLTQNWVVSHSATFVLLTEGASMAAINERFPAFLKTYGNEQFRDNQSFSVMALRDIHTQSQAGLEQVAPANMNYLYLFIGIGLLTLVIACINFVNLSTASSLSRAREIGVRKAVGAGKEGIMGQFLGESILLSFLGFLISMVLLQLFLPYLNTLTQRELSFNIWQESWLSIVFLGIFLLTGLLAGIYPAFFVARFKPIHILKGKGYASLPQGARLRKVLVSIQFWVSIVLMAGTFGIYKQISYLQSQPMGFQQDQVINVPLFSPNVNAVFGGVDANLRQKTNAFEEELLKNPKVEAVTLSSGTLGVGAVRRRIDSDNIPPEENVFAAGLSVDYDFVETYALELVTGRSFGRAFGTDHLDAYVINESAVTLLGWESPEQALGQMVDREGKKGKVIGVVKDFHYRSLRYPIDAFIMDVNPATFNTFSIRIQGSDLPETIDFIESKWNTMFPEKVFENTFLDETIGNSYASDTRFGQIISYFAFLAILISCFGLYGLVTYTAVQKTKEIGIRKVLGASISHILLLLSKEFIWLIGIAGLLAFPLVYYGLQQWLSNFAFTIKLGVGLLLAPWALVLAIALLTLSYQALKAAFSDPVKALRYE